MAVSTPQGTEMDGGGHRRIVLAVPAAIRQLGTRATLRWQVDPGEMIEPYDPIARLDGEAGKALVLQAPEDCHGTVLTCWVEDGAEVVVGEPVLTLEVEAFALPDTSSRRDPRGLAEVPQKKYDLHLPGLSQPEAAGSPFDAPQTVSATRLSRHDRNSLAIVGALSLLGLLAAGIGVLVGLAMRSGAPALFVAVALAIVAVSLSYGKDRMDRIGG
jgi:hypothetical protein